MEAPKMFISSRTDKQTMAYSNNNRRKTATTTATTPYIHRLQCRICLQCRRPGLIPGWGRCPREGNGNPLQYSCLENPMTEELSGPQSVHGIAEESGTTEHTHITCEHRFSLPILKVKSQLIFTGRV